MIPVNREPGPWSKYLHREIQKGKDGGYKCEKCGNIFSVLPELWNHSCPVKLQEKINKIRSNLGQVNIELPSEIDCIDSNLCVGSLEAVIKFRKNDLSKLKVEVLDVRSYFDPVTWEPWDSVYRLVDEIRRLQDSGKIGLIHCFAGVDRSPFVACLYLGTKYNLLFKEAYKLVKERRPQTTIHMEWLTKMGIGKV
jgi:protein-tyrosine phosphatase